MRAEAIGQDALAEPRETADARGGSAAAIAPVLTVSGVSKSFGGVAALHDIDLMVRPGEIRAIIGPNGAGKSTLINLISGLHRPDSGTLSFSTRASMRRPGPLRARDLARFGVQRTFQNLALFDGLSVEDNVAMGRTAARRAGTIERIIGLGRVRRERAETQGKVDAILAFLELEDIRARSVAALPTDCASASSWPAP